ncbi:MAG: hypothetical protein QM654_09415 [Dysgonamonadaceae bacterium]
MEKSHIVILILLLAPCLLIFLNDKGISNTIKNNIVFKQRLSEYGLYQGKISELIPCEKAETIEIASASFTDYTEKQRIILLPKGQKMKAKGNGLRDFPNGTIITKTFFYQNKTNDKTKALHILETCLLIKDQNQWNDTQNEAYLLKDGTIIPVSFVDEKGSNRTTNYKIPSRADCISCHRQNDKIFSIGLKMTNINIAINRDQDTVNQSECLRQKGKLEITGITQIATTTDYKNEAESLEMRAREYLDINCAHCHNPNGIGYITQLDLRNETAINHTGIWLKQGKIAYRMATSDELHMPKIATTIPHDEGVKLILDYIANLK